MSLTHGSSVEAKPDRTAAVRRLYLRFLPRFGLRTLLVLLVVVSIGFATIGRWLYKARERDAAYEIIAQNASVLTPGELSVPWYVRLWTGDNWLAPRHAHLIDCELTAELVGALAKFPEISDVYLEDVAIGPEGSELFRTRSELGLLILDRPRVRDSRFWSAVADSGVRDLEVIGEPDPLTDQGVASQPSRLRDDHLPIAVIDEEVLIALAGNSELGVLHVRNARLMGRELDCLKDLNELTHLSLDSCAIGDHAARALGALAPLRQLHLPNNPLGDAVLAELRGHRRLLVLDVAHTNVTDAGLVHVGTIEQLFTLDVSGTQVTDAGLQHLTSLKSLERLNVADTNVTDAGIESLRKELPQLEIDF